MYRWVDRAAEEAFLIHVGSAREAIEKKGYFKSFEDHSEDYSDNNSEVSKKDKKNPNRPFSSIRCRIGQRGSSKPSLSLM